MQRPSPDQSAGSAAASVFRRQSCDSFLMETRGIIITAASIIVGVQIGLFAWLKADISTLTDRMKTDIGALTERVDRVEREVAFVRGQLSLVLPSLAEAHRIRRETTPAQ